MTALPEWSWRDFAAVWGACLSTVLALSRLLIPRPVFHIEPAQKPAGDLLLRIVNPGRKMVLVRRGWSVRLGSKDSEVRTLIYGPGTAENDVPPTVLAIPSEGEERLLVEFFGVRPSVLTVFWWRRSWLFSAIAVPVPVVLSKARADRLKSTRVSGPLGRQAGRDGG